MKKTLSVIATIWTITLYACKAYMPLTPTTTSTIAPAKSTIISTQKETLAPELTETPIPTLVYYLFPSLTPDPKRTPPTPQPTITAPPARISPSTLPGNLAIEEYKITSDTPDGFTSLVHARHPNSGGWYRAPKGGLVNGELFQAIQYQDTKIRATLGDKEIFVVDCAPASPFTNLITAWTYGEHWVIQSMCQDEFDIFLDGKSLNKSKGYQSSFAFQVMDKKPFYLFKRNEKVWMFYEETEVLLGYDEVALIYCCEVSAPVHYENMIIFNAKKDGQVYYVAIGIFEK